MSRYRASSALLSEADRTVPRSVPEPRVNPPPPLLDNASDNKRANTTSNPMSDVKWQTKQYSHAGGVGQGHSASSTPSSSTLASSSSSVVGQTYKSNHQHHHRRPYPTPLSGNISIATHKQREYENDVTVVSRLHSTVSPVPNKYPSPLSARYSSMTSPQSAISVSSKTKRSNATLNTPDSGRYRRRRLGDNREMPSWTDDDDTSTSTTTTTTTTSAAPATMIRTNINSATSSSSPSVPFTPSTDMTHRFSDLSLYHKSMESPQRQFLTRKPVKLEIPDSRASNLKLPKPDSHIYAKDSDEEESTITIEPSTPLLVQTADADDSEDPIDKQLYEQFKKMQDFMQSISSDTDDSSSQESIGSSQSRSSSSSSLSQSSNNSSSSSSRSSNSNKSNHNVRRNSGSSERVNALDDYKPLGELVGDQIAQGYSGCIYSPLPPCIDNVDGLSITEHDIKERKYVMKIALKSLINDEWSKRTQIVDILNKNNVPESIRKQWALPIARCMNIEEKNYNRQKCKNNSTSIVGGIYMPMIKGTLLTHFMFSFKNVRVTTSPPPPPMDGKTGSSDEKSGNSSGSGSGSSSSSSRAPPTIRSTQNNNNNNSTTTASTASKNLDEKTLLRTAQEEPQMNHVTNIIRLTRKQLLMIIKSLLSAVYNLHKHCIFHNDVHGHNIQVNETYDGVVLLDFGQSLCTKIYSHQDHAYPDIARLFSTKEESRGIILRLLIGHPNLLNDSEQKKILSMCPQMKDGLRFSEVELLWEKLIQMIEEMLKM
jgi:hypothetical protein